MYLDFYNNQIKKVANIDVIAALAFLTISVDRNLLDIFHSDEKYFYFFAFCLTDSKQLRNYACFQNLYSNIQIQLAISHLVTSIVAQTIKEDKKIYWWIKDEDKFI